MGVGSDFTKGAQYSRNEMITARNRFERERSSLGLDTPENNRLDISNQEFRFKWSRKRRSLGFALKDSGSRDLYSRLVHARLPPSTRTTT